MNIRTKLKIKYISIFLSFCLITFLFSGCADNKRIGELEQRVVELQEELLKKELTIQELQEEPKIIEEKIEEEKETENTDDEEIIKGSEEDKIVKVINQYINAVEKQNFAEQKKYVSKYALDLVNFKDEESKKTHSLKDRTVTKQTPTITKIEDNNAEGFMSFTEHLVDHDNTEYDLITEGKVFLEKINNEWKIIDYTRKNRLISKSLYLFNDIKTTQNNIDIEVNRMLVSLYDSYIFVKLKITNNNDETINIAFFDSAIIGSDKIQNQSRYYDENITRIFPNASAIGEVEYNWSNSSVSDFTLYTGYVYGEDGYHLFDNIPIEIELDKAIRY